MKRFPLQTKKERRTLTWRGRVLVLILATGFIAGLMLTVHPFLAQQEPIQAEVLIVEGWLPDYALKQAYEEFSDSEYQYLVTTGGPLERGSYLAEYKNHAQLAGTTLLMMGLNPDKLIVLPAPDVKKDRTYESAMAVKRWCDKVNFSFTHFNVITEGTHARRSRLLFDAALGDEINVGVISVENQEYNPRRWWESSDGVKEVIMEMIAYLYARFLFEPFPN